MDLTIGTFYTNGVIQYVSFYIWLFSRSMFSRFPCVGHVYMYSGSPYPEGSIPQITPNSTKSHTVYAVSPVLSQVPHQ
jgi:hypothetical protein